VDFRERAEVSLTVLASGSRIRARSRCAFNRFFVTSTFLTYRGATGDTSYSHRKHARMITQVRKWGNSQGLRLPRQILADASIRVGDDVDVSVREGAIIVAPVRPRRGRHDLRELVARIPKGDKGQEVQWGEPSGKEEW
jgi:antitoxin MazE